MAQDSIGKYKMVVVGGSAGSLDAVMKIVAAMRPGIETSFVIIVHRGGANESVLEELLSTKTELPVQKVEDKEEIRKGTIYVAPPDYHLLLDDEHTISLDTSEKVHHSRPSIDVTFESAAEVYGPSLVGILLSGANEDGAEGLLRIAELGGHTIVQNPVTADVGFMPQSALNLLSTHVVLNGDEIGEYLREVL